MPQAALADAKIPKVEVQPGEDPTGRAQPPAGSGTADAPGSAFVAQICCPTIPLASLSSCLFLYKITKFCCLLQMSQTMRWMMTRQRRCGWTSVACPSASRCRRCLRGRLGLATAAGRQAAAAGGVVSGRSDAGQLACLLCQA